MMYVYCISLMVVCSVLDVSDFSLVEDMFGRFFVIYGKVVYGEKKGCIIGFFIVNVLLKCCCIFIYGVFVVCVLINNEMYKGVVNIGICFILDGERN